MIMLQKMLLSSLFPCQATTAKTKTADVEDGQDTAAITIMSEQTAKRPATSADQRNEGKAITLSMMQ